MLDVYFFSRASWASYSKVALRRGSLCYYFFGNYMRACPRAAKPANQFLLCPDSAVRRPCRVKGRAQSQARAHASPSTDIIS